MKSYLEVEVSSNEHQRELLIPTMVELGCHGFEETETSLLCYFEKSGWNASRITTFKDALNSLLKTISVNAVVRFKEIIEENWNEQWERSIKAIEIGNRIVIKPSWAEYPNDHHRIVIQIDPKMSFGTGYHETTRLTISLLEKYVKNNQRVLDVGTGTGILAIAAVKLGATAAEGTDIDDWCIENATENVLANDVHKSVQISKRGVDEFLPNSFDLLTANLTLNTNIELLPQFHRALRSGGILLLSGLLKDDGATMKEHLGTGGWSILEETFENEWIAIASACRK